MDFATHMAEGLHDYRQRAINKDYSYETRLMYDKMAARREQMIIDHANRIIERNAARA